MAEETYPNTERPEVIRQQMEETRTSLAEKLETLEQKVSSTVLETASAVTETVENVKETVESSVEAVKETLNLRLQTERHPWEMIGGAFAIGFLGGWITTRGPHPIPPPPALGHVGPQANLYQPAASSYATQPSSWLSKLSPEIEKLKGLAIGTVAGLVRDALAEAVPESMRPQVTEMLDDLASRFGGKPLPSPVLGTDHEERSLQPESMSAAGSR
jgi:hypothetical protein